MPKAAWCSKCGSFIWIAPDGSCQNGHGPEYVSGVYETDGQPAPAHVVSPALKPDARVSWVSVGAVVLIVALVSLLSATVFIAARAADSRSFAGVSASITPADEDVDLSVDPESSVPDNTAPVTAAPSSETTTNRAALVRTTTNPDIAAPALDAFIAREYPGYTVTRRISFPDQWEEGRLSVNYLLRNKKRPRFELLVSVAEMKKGEAYGEWDWPCFQVGDVLTDDEVFSLDARKQYAYLTDEYQTALMDGYLAHIPSKGAFAYGAYVDSLDSDKTTVYFSIEAGPGALEWAMRDSGGESQWEASSVVTSGAKRPRVTVTSLGK